MIAFDVDFDFAIRFSGCGFSLFAFAFSFVTVDKERKRVKCSAGALLMSGYFRQFTGRFARGTFHGRVIRVRT